MVKSVLWRVPNEGDEKKVYLTFNDGPHPHLTPWVVDRLKEAGDLKATFFCIGEEATKHPDVVQLLKDEGHEIANHSQAHESGWAISRKSYFRSFLECENALGKTSYFRPPYGRITPALAKALSSRTQIVMWDVLSRDYDTSKSGKDCLENLKEKTRSGSIVVFHDSERAAPRLLFALPEYLKWLVENGYTPSLIPAGVKQENLTRKGVRELQAQVGLTDSA
jgi:peptidoglycan/xylan/chitin deacetylase (PgdA/CDA1 family)